MKKLLLTLMALSGSLLAQDIYTFNMNVNQLSVSPDSSPCSQEMTSQLKQDIEVDPQMITLNGTYNIVKSTGSYNVINYQSLGGENGIYALPPLGLKGEYDFGKWNAHNTIIVHNKSYTIYSENVTINNHHYPLYGILFDVPGECKNQNQWGTCGILQLLIPDDSVANGMCILQSPLTNGNKQ